MTRVVKTKEERRAEIMSTASSLFNTQGYEKTSVNDIIEAVGVAKGTFYYYFKSKSEILSAIVDSLLDEMIESAQKIANNPSFTAVQKFEKIISPRTKSNNKANKMKSSLHAKENRELHEQVNTQLILRLSPVIADVIDQGKKEKVFKVKNSLETIQLIFAGSQFLFDDNLFKWKKSEKKLRQQVMQEVTEKALGAKKGTLNFLSK